MGETGFIPESAQTLNAFVTVVTLCVGFAQLVFFYNVAWSYMKGKKAGHNPWKANSLEWQTPEVPPGHGNFGPELPLVYRWAYDYGRPDAKDDYVPQNLPPDQVSTGSGGDDVADAVGQPAE
jgi:cytochrome c oxidase subunit 1